MTQELTDLRNSILEGRYEDALALVDELEGMSRQAILRNIKSFTVRLMVHLIKNQVEQRLTNSWAASLGDSVQQIQELNLKDNKTSHYIKEHEWEPVLEECLKSAIRPASAEVRGGRLSPLQLAQLLDRAQIIAAAHKLLALTYVYSAGDLPEVIDEHLAELPGGEDWKQGAQ